MTCIVLEGLSNLANTTLAPEPKFLSIRHYAVYIIYMDMYACLRVTPVCLVRDIRLDGFPFLPPKYNTTMRSKNIGLICVNINSQTAEERGIFYGY